MSEPRQRPEYEHWLLFVEACGGVCAACGKDAPPFHHGHIIRRKDSGPANFHNAIPVCAACNLKYRHKDTPTIYRPADWQERFVKLLVWRFFGNQITGKLTVSFPTNAHEKERVIDFSGDQKGIVFPKLVSKPPLTDDEAKLLVERCISNARRGRTTPWTPKEATKNKLIGLALTKGSEVFSGACREFVNEELWLDEKGRARPMEHWLPLADGFYDYEGRYYASLRAKADSIAKARAEASRQARANWRSSLLNGVTGVLDIEADSRFWNEVEGNAYGFYYVRESPTWERRVDRSARELADYIRQAKYEKAAKITIPWWVVLQADKLYAEYCEYNSRKMKAETIARTAAQLERSRQALRDEFIWPLIATEWFNIAENAKRHAALARQLQAVDTQSGFLALLDPLTRMKQDAKAHNATTNGDDEESGSPEEYIDT